MSLLQSGVIIQKHHQYIEVSDETHIGNLRRSIRDMAIIAGFNSEAIGRAEIVATELGTNIVKHAHGQGFVLARNMEIGDQRLVELIALDTGPGIGSESMFLDGVSTAGTMGGGLGAIRRLSTEFHIYSELNAGTAILSRISQDQRLLSHAITRKIGGVSVAIPGESVCADGWAVAVAGDHLKVFVADGIGHGPRGTEPTQLAMRLFNDYYSQSTTELLDLIHQGLRSTIGAVAAVAAVDQSKSEISYCGIGNISGSIFNPEGSQGCVSLGGIVGLKRVKIKDFRYSWPTGARLLMHSDGLKTMAHSTHVSQVDPTLSAAILFRDFWRRTDDATVVIVDLDYRMN